MPHINKNFVREPHRYVKTVTREPLWLLVAQFAVGIVAGLAGLAFVALLAYTWGAIS